MTTHEFPFMVAYADTDAGGIVYHGRYVEIAERARMNWLRGARPMPGDLGFVVRRLGVDYRRPLRLRDEFVVQSRIVNLGAASMDIEQKFIKDGDVYVVITLTVAYLGGDMRPKRIPDQLLQFLEN